MNKRGLIGKIFAVIGIIILLILIVLGITAYQGYKAYNLMKTEQKSIEINAMAIASDLEAKKFSRQDCTRINSIEQSSDNIKQEMQSACKNPLIKAAVTKLMKNQQVPTAQGNVTISCNNLEKIYGQMQIQLAPIKNICNNETIVKDLPEQ
jgi:hypothetical protein